MEKRNAIASLLISGLILGGCTAKGPQFEKFETPQKGKSNIYIYRKAQFFGDGLRPDIHYTNLKTNSDTVLPKLLPDGYIKETVKAGNYKIWAKTEVQNEVIINAKENKNYCIQHYVTPGFFIGHPQFEIQDLNKCKPEIKKTKLSGQE
jgi:hypothetical protein